MDAALLAEREAFKRRAMAVPTIENKKRKLDSAAAAAAKSGSSGGAKLSSTGGGANAADKAMLSSKFKGVSGSQYKFGVLARIVRHMKTRHMEGLDHPLTLDEILDETNQLDVTTKTKQWLLTEALGSNPKIEMVEDRYIFRPPFKLRDKKSLIKLLKRRDLNGEGGVMYDDILESLAKAEKIVQNLTSDGKIIQINRPCDKRRVLFYYDHSTDFEVDEEFIKQWRSVSVEGVDDAKIEDYLDKQGIRSMQDQGLKKMAMPKRKKGQVKRKKTVPRDNEHLVGVLEDYSEMTAGKADR